LTTSRKFLVLAITALLVTGISGLSTVAGTPKPATTTTGSLTSLITSLINSVGDDTFSTIDLTTLVNTFTSTTPTPLHLSTSTAHTQPAASSSGTSTQHYGPYASGSPDSGTCGNNWADDTYNRHFTVFQNKDDGSLLVVEQFKDGSFLTPSTTPPNTNQSPGACNTSPQPTGNGGTVAAGIQGSFHGYFVIPLPTGTTQTSFDASCVAGSPSAPCTTTDFINTHFTPSCYPTTCTVTTFFFHYAAGDQGLIMNEWKNSSPDRGGNSGDIRSA
jgi:hypothetical protein